MPTPSPPRRGCAGSATCPARWSMATARAAGWTRRRRPRRPGPRLAPARRRTGLGLMRRMCGGYVPARRNLWAGPIGIRHDACGARATHRQAGPRLRPHPSRRHRGRGTSGHAARPGSRAAGVEPADDEPAESATVIAEAARCSGCPRRRKSSLTTRGRADEPDGAQLLGREPPGLPAANSGECWAHWRYPS